MKTASRSAKAGDRRHGWFLSALSLAVVTVALPAVASAELFVLKSGEVIEGDIVLATRNTITIRREIGGVRQVRTTDLEEVRILTPRGEEMVGQLLDWEGGVYRLAMEDRALTIENGVIVAEAALPPSKSPPPAASPTPEPAPSTVAEPAAPTAPATADVAPADPEPSTTEAVIAEATTVPGAGGPEVDIAAIETETPAAPPPTTDAEPVERVTEVRVVLVEAATTPITESSSEMVFSIKLSHPIEQPVVLIYATVDGSAKGGQDYEPQQGVMTLEPGSTLAELRTPLINDQVAEGDEHFRLFLSADPDVAKVNASQIVATIVDDDG